MSSNSNKQAKDYSSITRTIRNNIQWLNQCNTSQTTSKRNLINKWFLDSIKNYFMEQFAAPLLKEDLDVDSTQDVKEIIHKNIDTNIPKYMSIMKNYLDLLHKFNKIDLLRKNILTMISHDLEDLSEQAINESNYVVQKTVRKQFVGLLVLTYCDVYQKMKITSFYDLWNIIFPEHKQTKKRLSKYDMNQQQENKKKLLNLNSQSSINTINNNHNDCNSEKSQEDHINEEEREQEEEKEKLGLVDPNFVKKYEPQLNFYQVELDNPSTKSQIFQNMNQKQLHTPSNLLEKENQYNDLTELNLDPSSQNLHLKSENQYPKQLSNNNNLIHSLEKFDSKLFNKNILSLTETQINLQVSQCIDFPSVHNNNINNNNNDNIINHNNYTDQRNKKNTYFEQNLFNPDYELSSSQQDLHSLKQQLSNSSSKQQELNEEDEQYPQNQLQKQEQQNQMVQIRYEKKQLIQQHQQNDYLYQIQQQPQEQQQYYQDQQQYSVQQQQFFEDKSKLENHLSLSVNMHTEAELISSTHSRFDENEKDHDNFLNIYHPNIQMNNIEDIVDSSQQRDLTLQENYFNLTFKNYYENTNHFIHQSHDYYSSQQLQQQSALPDQQQFPYYYQQQQQQQYPPSYQQQYDSLQYQNSQQEQQQQYQSFQQFENHSQQQQLQTLASKHQHQQHYFQQGNPIQQQQLIKFSPKQ